VSGVAADYDDSADVAKAIRDGLSEFNRKEAGVGDSTPCNVAVRDEAGNLVGGVIARINLDTVYIDHVWIGENLRGGGHGHAMMELVEDKARKLGARLAWLYTLSWQARPFYEKLGYRVFGEMPFGGGKHRRYFMRKEL
jgi:GNAT superfamily N-acetyltransferase